MFSRCYPIIKSDCMRTIILSVIGLGCCILSSGQSADDIREKIAQDVVNLKVAPVPVASVQNTVAILDKDTVLIRIYKPSATKRNLPVIYHIHGGGFVAGDLNTHDNICRVLCKESNAIVVSVDYRRPPENPYPAAVNDSYIVLKWIDKNMRDLGGNGKIIVIGDSAGGNLAAVIGMKNVTEKKPVPVNGMILVNPGLDARDGSSSMKAFGDFVKMYVPDTVSRHLYTITPLLGENIDKLPQTLIIVSEKDPIKDEGYSYQTLLRDKGVKTTLYEQKGEGHLGPLWAAADNSVRQSLNVVLATIKVWERE